MSRDRALVEGAELDPNRWLQIDDLFHAAVACAPPERSLFLDSRCAGDWNLRAELESLLAAHDRSSQILDSRAFEVVSQTHTRGEPHRLTGQTIGHYRICAFIGAGGAGAVYEAEQASPRRTVALKLMRALPYHDELTVRLFRREGQALARLQHPGIAAIYEAGQTDDGWHYFAMERVLGAPLTQYVRERELSLPDRLALFILVCDAVQYAHQRGVIHRDLKPSNILVMQDGRPKVLDFGLARVTDGDGEHSQTTEAGSFHGTLAYASPEQTRGNSADIDARSDVYSLGVILYELLTDRLPYETRGTPFAEAARVVCEQRPPRAGAARRAIRGELETILEKALEKEPARRYQSVAQLSSDVTRYLRNEPIAARPASTLYQLRKLVLRHKAPFALAALLFLAVACFAVIAAIQAMRIRAQRDVAIAAEQHEAKARRQAEEVSDFFLRDLFEVTDPQKAQVEKLTAREILDKGAQRIEQRFEGQPETQATLMLSMGRVYSQLGLLPSARDMMQSAVSLRLRLFGEENLEVAAAKFQLGRVLRQVGEPERAEKLQQEALDVRRRLLGATDLAVAQSLEELSVLRKARAAYQEAADYVEQAIAIYRMRCGDVSGEVAFCLDTLSRIRSNQARYAESIKLGQDALAMSRKVYGDKHPTTAYAMANLARQTDSIPLFEESLEVWRELQGDESLEVVGILEGIGNLQIKRDDWEHAEGNLRRALTIRRRLQGSDNADVAALLESLARIPAKRFQLDEAEVLIRESFQIRRKLYHEPSEQEIYAWCGWATRLYLDMPDYEEADRLTRAGYEVAKKLLPDNNIFAVYCQHWRACVLARRGEYDEAEQLFRESLERNTRAFGAEHAGVAEFDLELASLLVERGKTDEAESLILNAWRIFDNLKALNAYGNTLESLARARHRQGDYETADFYYRQALDFRMIDYGAVHPLTAICMLHFAELFHDRGDFAAAQPLYEGAIAVLTRFFELSHPDVLAARVGLGKLLHDLGKSGEAEGILREALDDQIRVMGENHPHVARTRCLLGQCLIALGKKSEGEPSLAIGLERLQAVYPPQHCYIREATRLAKARLKDDP